MNRLFLALKAQLSDYNKIQSNFSGLLRGRWVPSENLHITLCYFGDRYSTSELLEKLPPLIEKIEPLDLISLGYFKHNNILYTKIKSQKLEMLHSSICSSLSMEQSQAFIPHVTLMRIKEIHNQEVFKHLLNDYKDKNIGKLDSTLELIQSHLQQGGARYESIKRFTS